MHLNKLLRSSTFRLTLVYMALLGSSVLILLSFIYWSTAAYMAQQADATIEAEIAGLAERYRSDGLTGLTSVIARRSSRKPGGSSIYLLADLFLNPLIGNLDRWPTVPETEDGWLNFRLEGADDAAGDVHRARARAFRLEGGFHLLVGRDVHDLEQTQERIVTALIWGLAITVVLALVGGFAMTRSTIRRIETINQTSREIISGDLSRRIPRNYSGDDFDVLTGNLNAMLDRIEALMEDVRRVSDNIAHDLKTPLSRLRNSLELLRDGDQNTLQIQTLTERAVAEADALLGTFKALLRIARVEASDSRAEFSLIALADIVRDVAELYEPLAEQKDQQFTVVTAANVSIEGDRDLLFQAFANLLDNAIKYTPSAGRIQIEIEHNANGPQITVSDTGPGIPETARERVFQRFYRLEESRSTPGNGLGLSLVAAVAKLHDADVHLADGNPGLRVEFTFKGNRTKRIPITAPPDKAGKIEDYRKLPAHTSGLKLKACLRPRFCGVRA